MENDIHPIINKIINASPDTYVIFFTYGCPYSERALQLLRNKHVPYKGYDINEINGNMQKLLLILNKNKDLIGFDSNHKTRPVIFLNGKFLGGYDQLSKSFDNNKL